MSFQCDGQTTIFISGSWQKKGGKMEFVEEIVETTTNFDCQEEASSLDEVSLDIYGGSLHPIYSVPCHVEKDGDYQIYNNTEQSLLSYDGCLDQPHVLSNPSVDILDRLNNLETEIKVLQQENNTLKSAVAEHEIYLDEQLAYIYSLEKDLSRLDQYGRRENIEIMGIPSNIKDDELEREVIKILQKIGLYHLDHYGIVACHRVGKHDFQGNRNTIVRFLNRKDAIQALK